MIIKRAFIIVVLNLLVYSSVSFAQISPGDLVNAHAHLEGMSNCTKCHVLGSKVTNEKCLDCHLEIKTRIEQNKGYHASTEVKGKECAKCHNDHHGREFEIIRFKTDTFNHQLSGYELLGKHQKTLCKDCHRNEFIIDMQLKDRSNTYLGLGRECLNCHIDYHQGSLANNCTNCHTHQAFKPAENFDHQKTKFVLRGKHKEVDCLKCHLKEIKNGKDFQKFSGIRFDNCTACHKDEHQNKFGQNCKECHNENSFREVKLLENFNHNLTDFPLQGKHAKVNCKECHKTGYTATIAHKSCSDCHADYHKNEFDLNGKDPKCDDCHSLNGFTPSTYSIEKHNLSKFPLNGAHLASPCFSCHLKNDTWKFRKIGVYCVDCHEDIHKEYIDKIYYPQQNCKICHSENSWKSIQFEHNLTNFKLKGAHQKQDCRACHFPKTENGINTQRFASLKGSCTECHNDIHQNQFEINGISDCSRCHSSENWTIQKFDHSKTLFPLDGAHEKVSCKSCHKTVNQQNANYILYKIKEYKCADCHS